MCFAQRKGKHVWMRPIYHTAPHEFLPVYKEYGHKLRRPAEEPKLEVGARQSSGWCQRAAK